MDLWFGCACLGLIQLILGCVLWYLSLPEDILEGHREQMKEATHGGHKGRRSTGTSELFKGLW